MDKPHNYIITFTLVIIIIIAAIIIVVTAIRPVMQYDVNGLFLLKMINKHLIRNIKHKRGKNEENIEDFVYTLKGHHFN